MQGVPMYYKNSKGKIHSQIKNSNKTNKTTLIDRCGQQSV